MLIELGGAEARAGALSAAEHLEQAIALAPGPDQLGQAASHLARVLMSQGRMPDAVRVLQQAIAAAGEAPERLLRLKADLVVLADIDLAARPLIDAHLRQAMVQGTSPFTLGHRAIELVCTATSSVLAGELAEAALADGTLLGKSVVGVQYYFAMVFVLAVSGSFAAAAHHADAGLELARRRGAGLPFVTGSAQRAGLGVRRGALSDAEADARAALEVARVNGWPPLAQMAMTALMDALLEREEPERAASELAASGLAAVPGSETVQDTVLLEARGRLRIALNQIETGVADLLEAGRRLLSWEMRNPAPFGWRSAAALGLARLGQRERALSLAGEEVELARAWGDPFTLGRALRRAGLVTGGNEGIFALREAVAVLAPSGAELERARALTELGAALRRQNLRAEARTTLREALGLARTCQSEGVIRRAHTELWATGVRPRTPLRTGVDSLTPSERRVAEMAAAGQSNPAIAQSLFVTVKTIEMHLSSAYRRLGIAGRGELPGALSGMATRPPSICPTKV
ncbi:MAG: helix-turn-helix transcriptional regulator [Solirubrobacteraceae bacterium]